MKIGVVKEIKDRENRVALTPSGAAALVQAGHTVRVETQAGLGAGFSDAAYEAAGACIDTVDRAWDADLVLKVKEPLEAEYPYIKEQILFTYLHLAGVSPGLTTCLLQRHTTAVAYETVEDSRGALPLLAPMSAIAGNMSITVASFYLAHFNQGKGVQLGTVMGQGYGKVAIIGDGVVGQHAARTAAGLGSEVFLGCLQPQKVAALFQDRFPNVHCFPSNPQTIASYLSDADVVVGAVLLHGAKAPHVVTEEVVMQMQPGSVIVDVSIDQGGCIATSRPTSHSAPIFMRHGVVHYCVTNMPGAYPRTATLALANATLPYVMRLADQGLQALRDDAGFGKGVNVHNGSITSEPVARTLQLMRHFKTFS
jgi:alanine dehydrogenase